MFKLTHNVSLKEYNTFGISVNTKEFLSVQSLEDLISFFSQHPEYRCEKKLILGGGSNLLFLDDFSGLIIHPEIKGINIFGESPEKIDVEVGAGEDWDHFVEFCVNNGWGGVENLSLIPGNVGAVPVQNIGAYGVEVKSSVLKVNVLDLDSLKKRSFESSECHFDYRSSIFKNKFKNRYLITSVIFRLMKNPVYNTSYGILKNELAKYNELNLKNIREAVISIRNSKLPDPKIIGNAGSFFKNPVVKPEVSDKIQKDYPEVPVYPAGNGMVKLAAGWLIEKSGWKGKAFGNAAVHDKQALVLVNGGNATGIEIYNLAQIIREDVLLKFSVELEPEVNIVGKQI